MGAEGPWPWQCQRHSFPGQSKRDIMKIFTAYNIELQIGVDDELTHDEYLSQAELESTHLAKFDKDRTVYRYCIL